MGMSGFARRRGSNILKSGEHRAIRCQKLLACTLGTLTCRLFESAFFASFLCRFGQRNDVPPRTVANSDKEAILKVEWGVPRTQASIDRCLRSFTKDEGRPFGVGLQEQAPVCHERRCEPAMLYQRWESASRNRLAGADIKPPSAAASKRCGRERLGKRRSDRTSGTY